MTDKHSFLARYRTAFPASRHASRSARAARRLGALTVAVFALTPLAVPAVSPAAAAGRETVPRGHSRTLISAKVIERISKRAVAAELASARLGPGDPALGAGRVRYGLVAYRVLYRTVNAAAGLSAPAAWLPSRLAGRGGCSWSTTATAPPA